MKFIFAMATLLAVFVSGEARADRTVPIGHVSYWSIYAYYDDKGEFGFCGMRTGSVDGPEQLTLSMNEAGVMMFLDSNAWRLPVGDAYDVAVSIGPRAWTGKAKVYTSNGVNMWWSWSQDFADAFMAGSRMEIQFRNGKSWNVNLSGSRRALNVVAQCLIDNKVSRNPFK